MAEIHDPVLQKQKEELLGNLAGEVRSTVKTGAMQEAAFVEFEKIEILCPGRPSGDITVDLKKVDGTINDFEAAEYTLKEDSWTQMRITFKVHRNIVLGLKICSAVNAKVKFMKDEEVMGTFPPTDEAHVVTMDKVHTPEGFFARGTYKGKLMFTDADTAVHLMYNYKVKIAKNW